MTTHATAMAGICTNRPFGSSTGFEAGEMLCGGTARRIGGVGRGVQGQAMTGDDANIKSVRQNPEREQT